MLVSLTALCNRGKSCKSRAEGIYSLCRDAADLSRERLHSNPRQVKLIYYTTISSKPPFKIATLLFVATALKNNQACSSLTLIATLTKGGF